MTMPSRRSRRPPGPPRSTLSGEDTSIRRLEPCVRSDTLRSDRTFVRMICVLSNNRLNYLRYGRIERLQYRHGVFINEQRLYCFIRTIVMGSLILNNNNFNDFNPKCTSGSWNYGRKTTRINVLNVYHAI